MKKYQGNWFIKFESIYTLLVIIIKNFLGHNSQSIFKQDWDNFSTIYIVSHMATPELSLNVSNIVKLEMKVETEFNSYSLQTLTSL